MKKTINILLLAATVTLSFTSCTDWLDVLPKNEQVSTEYWKSKEEVEAVINSGYYQMRQAVPSLIKWGELRGGAMFSNDSKDTKLQDFLMTPDNSLCDYGTLYKIINFANSVIKNAPKVQASDNTYYDAVMNSHLCEAYFQRAYCYLILVKNFKEVPLVLNPYTDDSQDTNAAKDSEEDIVKQIKADVETALATKSAKSTYENDWETKGRVTKWALYALMADVSLWSEDYETCKEYCDMILDANKSGEQFYPRFLKNTQDWYTIFYPGNSNESIFELNWNYELAKESNNFSLELFPMSNSGLNFTTDAIAKMDEEVAKVMNPGERTGRMNLATYATVNGTKYLWKYYGNDVADIEGGVRLHQDANFILYRVAEIILMKAQAEVMTGHVSEAIDLVNQIRERASLPVITDAEKESYGEENTLEEILHQKEMEFFGEAKRWYDLLWLARIDNHKYKNKAIEYICEGNQTTKAEWIKSSLIDNYAWYIPLPQKDIEHNQLLVQNPYYSK